MSGPPSQRRRKREHLLRVASALALFALALIVAPIFRPTPVPVLFALTVGQALGTASFVTFLVIVAADLRVKRTLRAEDDETDRRA
jgi:hypothetical protein